MGQAASSAYAEQGMWDFRGADTKQFTHCFHIYPAMMIPQIARELILRYGVDGGLLFDPYCGTGTSLVESRLAGMNAIGTDINPTARMIAKSKILDYDLETLDQCIDSLLEDFRRKNASEGPLYGTKLEYYGTEPEYVTWERLEDWFPKRSISEISYVIEKIGEIEYDAASLFLRVALSECFRLVSYQRNGEFKLYRIPAEKRNEYYEPLLPKLLDRIERNRRGLDQYHSNIDKKTTVKICDFNTVQDDGSTHFPSKPSVDLVVTSPPYGDSGTTVAYAQFSWLSNVWLGLDDKAPGALDRELMGGRRTDVENFGCPKMDHAIQAIADEDDKRASEVMNFYNEYLLSIQNVASQIKKGGHVCFVVGNRTVKGTQLPTDQFTVWAFEQEGLEHITTYVRDIPNKRMPSRNSPSNKTGVTLSTMTHEYIVVCRKLNPEGHDSMKSAICKSGSSDSVPEYSLEELIEKMEGIVGIWHPDPRSGGDGDAGNLLEDLLGVLENPLPVADYGIYEIKTHRKKSGAKIKIFSLAPNPRPFSKIPFLEVVGWRDETHPETRKRFSYTKGVSGNSRGFRIVREGDTLSFIHDPGRVERGLPSLPYEDDSTIGEYADRVRSHPNFSIELPRTWDIRSTASNGDKNCETRIINKLQNVLCVERTSRKNPSTGQKEHKYHECWLLSSFRIDKFIEYLDNDVLNVDFNMSTKKDHGPSFRIDKSRLHELFDKSVKLI